MKKLLLVLTAASCFCLQLHAQTNNSSGQVAAIKNDGSINDIVAKLQTLSTDRVIEKAYLHFDKPYYGPGDTIYFKAYVTSGERHELSKISGVLNVDLIGRNDSVMHSVKLQLVNGQAWGDFALPPYLSKGNYRIRAYTQWMQNSGDAYFFDKIIPITGSSISKVSTAAPLSGKKADVQFFPEGGSLVVALPSRIAFKAIGADGLGINIKGVIIDNEDKEVTRFASAHLGMGQFYITPEAGKTYKAKLTYADGTVSTVDLPVPDAKGIMLTVNNDNPEKLAIEINANKPYYLDNKDKNIVVVIYSGGIVKTVKTALDNQSIGFDLPKKDLKTGITQVTLFSQTGMPLNERLVFIQNNDNLNITVNSDKPSYANSDKAHISINLPGNTALTAGSFSVSVTKQSKLTADENAERTILSDLLLTSDLKGYVEQPGYYFAGTGADVKTNLDILLLTQGYRRFVWNDLLNNDAVVTSKYLPENGLRISGVMQTKAGKPVPNEKLTLLLPETGQSLTTTTNAEGRFEFKDLAFADRSRFLVKTENPSLKSKTKIIFDKKPADPPVSINTSFINTANNLPANNNLQQVDHTAGTTPLKQVSVTDRSLYHSSNIAGAGHADQVIFNKDIRYSARLSDALDGRLRGVQFTNGIPTLKTSTVVGNGSMVIEPMLIIIDGVMTSGGINNYNPGDIESVELLKGANASIYGVAGGAGVLIINTKQGGGDGNEIVSTEMSPGLVAIAPQGFYKAREFYVPVNDVDKKPAGDQPKTIFWKPNLVTDKAGNASFDYINVGPGIYRLVVEGIDDAGNIGRSVYKYQVQ